MCKLLDARVNDYVVEPSSNQHYYNTVTNTLASQRSANLVTPSITGKSLLLFVEMNYCFLIFKYNYYLRPI